MLDPPAGNGELRSWLLRLASVLDEHVQHVDVSSVEFVRATAQVLQKVPMAAESALQYQCLSAAVPYLYAHNELDVALVAARRMVAVAQRANDPELLRKGLNFLGIIEKALGNITDGIVHLQRSVELSQELHQGLSESLTLGNLAGAFVEASLYAEALACIERIEQLAAGTSDHADALAMARIIQSQLYLRLGDRTKSHQAARRSLALWREPRSVPEFVSRALRKAHYVQLSLELGNLEEARQHAADCQRYAKQNPTPATSFFARISTGLVQVASGDLESGLDLLEQARLDAADSKQVGYREDACMALAWAYERALQPDAALECLREWREQLVERRKEALAVLLQSRRAVDEGDRFEFLAMDHREAKLKAEVVRANQHDADMDLLQRLAIAATLRDDASGLHGHRVGRLSALVAAKLGWSPRECASLEMSARLHDIGKTGLPDHVLMSGNVAKEAEREFAKTHCAIGFALLSEIQSDALAQARDVALHHHERWDGAGFPKGLAGTAIPIAARIVAIADLFDALTHGRPYSAPRPAAKAIEEIAHLSGSHFDPQICGIFSEVVSKLLASHADLDGYLGASAETSPFIAARREIGRWVRPDAARG